MYGMILWDMCCQLRAANMTIKKPLSWYEGEINLFMAS